MKQCFQKLFTGVLVDACPELGFEQIRLTPNSVRERAIGVRGSRLEQWSIVKHLYLAQWH